VLQRVKAVYRWAVTHERIESNPMLDLVPSEILKPREVQHRAALADRDLPEFLGKLAAYGGDVHTAQALRLLILTATRPGETRGARWAEFDLDAALWTIPPERMKMRVEHRVPLSRQALEVLRTMQALSGGRELVFPSPFYPSQPLSENTFNSALARMGYKNTATAHGFRALFSTVANECGWNPDVIERQLAHKEQNEIRAAYHRSTYMHDRAKPDAMVGGLPGRPQGGQRGEDAPAGRLIQPRMALPPPCYRCENRGDSGDKPRNPATMRHCRPIGQWGQSGGTWGTKWGHFYMMKIHSIIPTLPFPPPPILAGPFAWAALHVSGNGREGAFPWSHSPGRFSGRVSPRFVPGAAVQTCAPIQRDRCIVCPVDNFCPFVC
jgi:hypothetical protein